MGSMRCRHSKRRYDGPPTSATWGARCGKSARRVLRGGTGTSDFAARLVPTHHNLDKSWMIQFMAHRVAVIERQKIVRLLIQDILVGEDTITIRHSIPIPSGAPKNGGLESAGSQNYLLCKWRDFIAACERLARLQ